MGTAGYPLTMANHGLVSERDSRRFWSKVDRGGPDECWEWQGGRNPRGYGKFWMTGSTISSHRASFVIEYGFDVPPRKWILHSCDNPPCVNPAHLRVGDNDANLADKLARERQSRGERHGMSKLDAYRVMSARYAWRAGIGLPQIANMLGVTEATIHRAVTCATWAHLPEVENLGEVDNPIVKPKTRVVEAMNQRGAEHYAAKLTDAIVVEIRNLAAAGASHVSIAEKFSIGQAHTTRIIRGETWKHLPGAIPLDDTRRVTRLTDQQVRDLRQMAADGTMHKDIAARFGITRSYVSTLVARKSRGDVV